MPDDKQIPIAKYDEDGKDAEHYREFLAQKYGSKNQLISGIHFNFSYSEKLLDILYRKINPSLSYEEFKDEAYLKTIRQMLRMRWLYILLYGSSPVVDSSLELKCKLAPYSIDKDVEALSIRNSCYGYRNIGDLYPDYSSVKNFRSSIKQMIEEKKIASSKELYSPVRLKFIKSPEHITYIELRFIDIDPLTKAGVTKEELSFLHALALYGLLSKEDDDFDVAAQAKANKYHGCVALYGLDEIPCMFEENGEQINIWNEAEKLIREMMNLFEELGIDKSEYRDSLLHVILFSEC